MRFISSLRFRFRLIPFIATLVMMAIGISSGSWQLRRADAKQAIAVKLAQRAAAPALSFKELNADAAGLEYRHVELQGEFLAEWPLYLDNRPQQGRAGFYVLMPFRPAGSHQVVLVQRGWVARDVQDRTRLPLLATPAGIISLKGQLLRAPGKVMQLGEPPSLRPGAIVQNLDLMAFGSASGLPVQPYLVQQASNTSDGLVRDWPLPSSGIDRHFGYAFQWYGLAVMAGLFFVVTGFKRGKSESP